MDPDRSDRGGARRVRVLLALAVGIALACATVAQAAAPSPAASANAAARLSAAIAGSARLTRASLAPAAKTVAKALPSAAARLDSLQGPAATTEEQLRVALGQLQQVSPLAYDPHYLPALLAVGRAYLAAAGADPITGITVDPEYTGLRRELAAGRAQLRRSASRAATVAEGLRALSLRLAREKRHAARLAATLDRLRGVRARR